MSDAVKTLLWKEYRENFRVWGAAVVDGLLLLTGAVLARDALSIRGETVFSLGALVVLVYATILSADIFVREKEDGYLPFLNRFPITARQVAAAKFLWIALSTFALAVVFAAVCQGLVLSGLFTAENPIPSFRFFLSRGVVSLNGILWGLFWSTRAARRLSAIILTMLSTVAIPLLAEIFSQTITGAFMASLFLFVECVVCEFLVCPILDGIDNWFNERGRKKAEGESMPLLDKLRPRSALTVLTAQGIFQLRGAAAMLQLTALLPVPLLIAAAALPPSEPKQSLELLTLLVVAGVLFFGIFLTGTFLVRDFQEGNHSFLLRLPPRPLLFWFSRLAGICCVWVLPAALGLGMALTAGNAFGRESHLFSESLLEQFPAFRVWEIANAFVFAAAVPLLGLWTGALCRNRITSISLEIFLLAVLLTSAFVTTPPSMSPLAHLIPLSLFAAGSYDLVRRQLRGTVSIAYRVAHLLLLPAAALAIILVIFPVVRIYSVALLPDRFDPDQIARYGWTDRLRAERDYFRQRPLRRACKAEALAAIRANETGNRTAESIPIERVFQRRLEFRERGLDVLTPGWEYFWTSQSFLEPVTESLWSREEEFFRAIHQSVETAAPEQLRRFIEVLGAIPQIRPSGPRLEEAIDRLYHAQVTASYLYGYLSDEEPREFFIPRINDRRLRWERAAVCRRFLHNKRILDLCAARQAEQTIYAAGPVRSSGVAAGIVSVPAARKLYERQPSDQNPGISWFSEESLLYLRRTEELARRGMCLPDDYTDFPFDLGMKQRRRVSVEERMLLPWAGFSLPKPYQIEVMRLMAMVESALFLYWHEHDRQWPETIDDLVAAGYLPAVPTLPGGGFDRPVRFELSPRAKEPIRFTTKDTSKGQTAYPLPSGGDADPKSRVALFELPENETSLLPDRFLTAAAAETAEAARAVRRNRVRCRPLWGPPRGRRRPADPSWGWSADTGKSRRLVSDRPFPFVREAARTGIDPVTGERVAIQPSGALFGAFPIEIEEETAEPKEEAAEPRES